MLCSGAILTREFHADLGVIGQHKHLAGGLDHRLLDGCLGDVRIGEAKVDANTGPADERLVSPLRQVASAFGPTSEWLSWRTMPPVETRSMPCSRRALRSVSELVMTPMPCRPRSALAM